MSRTSLGRSVANLLEFQPGEFISLIGPSGCGKSTLLRIIGDLIEPSSGEAVIGGKTAHQARLDRDYGMVFQEATLMDWRTVEKNVSLPLEMMGWNRARRRARVEELLALVELGGFEGHYPWQLSGGMQQRVAIARALTFHPALILMDLSLPVLSGWDAARQLKSAEATRAIPIIALSAHALDGERDKALAAGCDDFETKPVDLARLLEKMQRLLNGAR